jgi:hypothetical protein
VEGIVGAQDSSPVNPNPGELVANMTTQNCYDKPINHKKWGKIVILHKRLVFNFV